MTYTRAKRRSKLEQIQERSTYLVGVYIEFCFGCIYVDENLIIFIAFLFLCTTTTHFVDPLPLLNAFSAKLELFV